MTKETLVPIQEAVIYSRHMHVNLNLPSWVPTDHIGIDIKRVERLLDLGGIEFLHVKGKGDEETTKTVPTVIGSTESGSLFAGKMGASEQVPDYTLHSSSDSSYGHFIRNTHWSTVDLQINTAQVNQSIRHAGENLKDPKPWAKKLDKIIRHGILNAGTKHLLTGFSPFEKIGVLLVTINNGILLPLNLSVQDGLLNSFGKAVTPEKVVMNVTTHLIMWNLIYIAMGRKSRLNFIPGYEIDRAFLLQILARTLPVIKPFEA